MNPLALIVLAKTCQDQNTSICLCHKTLIIYSILSNSSCINLENPFNLNLIEEEFYPPVLFQSTGANKEQGTGAL